MTNTKIMIIEDEYIVAQDLKAILERLGYVIPATAQSVEAAIQKMAEAYPDLVLLDINLKGTSDSVEAAQQIQERYQLPVVFLAASADEHTIQRAKVTGPFSCVLRPFKENEVRATIEMALYRHRLETELFQYNRKLLSLLSAGTAISSSLDLHQVLETITKQMAQLLDVDACTTFEWNPQADVLSLLAQYGTNGRWESELGVTGLRLVDHAFAKRALVECKPQQIRIDQPNLDPTELAYINAAKVKTLAVLPMLFKDRVVGFVEITDRFERTFTDQEMALVQLLANHAASAIENTRLYDEIRQRVEELTTLNEIGQAITSTLDLQKTLTIITGHIIRLLNADAASVALCDTVEGDMRFVAASGEAAEFVLGKRLSTSKGIAGWAVQHGEPVLVPDVSRDARFFGGFDQESGFNTRSILCVPLQTNRRTIGVIEAMNKRTGTFDQGDMRILSSLATPAATAIENARLYQRAQQEIVERGRAEAALEAERASLAHRVAERTAELRKANADLATASQLKDRFISNVSHELRTPLSVITLLSGNLDMLYERWDEGKRRQTIRDIRSQARLLNDLIESVLEVSRIDSNRGSSELHQVNLAQLIREEADKQAPLAQEKSQILRVTGVEHLSVTGNDGQLRQIIRNLLNNAIKYTPAGGAIACECQIRSGDDGCEGDWPGTIDLPSGRWAALRVTDTGIGIGQDNLPKLFERFYRVNEQGNIPGVGLGLSIAKELVELHNGHIAVASTLGMGAVFAVYLPLSEE